MTMATRLFKNFRIHQVFGANTSVGKTVITTALVRASSSVYRHTFYLKPVSTGPDSEADDGHVLRYVGPAKEGVNTSCLWSFKAPVSPHLAWKMALAEASGSTEATRVLTDDVFVKSILAHIDDCADKAQASNACMYIETAGGVHSPSPSSTPQVDAYRPLLLPTILVGSCHLGGISATLSAYESLLLRGYSIDCIILFRNAEYRNAEYLEQYFSLNHPETFVQTLQGPPPRLSGQEEEFRSMEKYYRDIAASDDVASVLRLLNVRHRQRIETLESIPRRTLHTVWWPFVQHGTLKSHRDVTVIDSANSDFFSVYHPDPTQQQGSVLRPHFDGSASWWTQAIGHAHPALTIAAARAAGRYGHVIFPQAIHLPALRLAERLLNDGPGKGWASRVFFSDNGSTGVEVALKMALRAFSVSRGSKIKDSEGKRLGVIGLKGSYHGDTIGAMNACEKGVFSSEWHDAKGYWFDPPTVSIRKGDVALTFPAAMMLHGPPSNNGIQSLAFVYNVPQRLHSSLASFYRAYITSTLTKLQTSADSPVFGALVLEPLVMGAGGMTFVDPLFQRVLVDVVRGAVPKSPSQWIGLPVIFDEVFVGLYRLGVESTASTLGVTPDISVYAKILTGGLLPLAVTLASDSIFRAFWSENKLDALLHGHSYTAHAVGCEVANETLRILKGLEVGGGWDWAKEKWAVSRFGQMGQELWSFWNPEFISELSSLNVVEEVMTLGTVLSIKIKDGQAGYGSHSAQMLFHSLKTGAGASKSTTDDNVFNIHSRTLGNVAYFMTSLNTEPATIRALEGRIFDALQTGIN